MFDIEKFRGIGSSGTRYDKQLERLKSHNINTSFIQDTIDSSLQNLNQRITSFVIYGEPQSGKTEMMICLTAKLLDEGHKIIIILLNDNVELLKQNLQRFKRSGISPDPKNFTEIIDPIIEIGDNEWVIFCKKNSKDLQKLIEKLKKIKQKVIIDDEADYASPNSKTNRGDKSKINRLIGSLLGDNGIYIGITATPARLDLNNTFDNANDKWVNFPPHEYYTGQDVFFPMNLETMSYRLNLLSDHGDDPKHLREALFSFFVNVAYLNLQAISRSAKEKNYCMLIHTSGIRADHTEDYKQIQKNLNILKNNRDNKRRDDYIKNLWEIADGRFGEEDANAIVDYILKNISRTSAVVMNSNSDKKNVDYRDATDPATPFTIAIGGNIVSRGVTFHNLLSMFFTRDVKHKIQQDTYIQRARMFGARNEYIKYFELSIPGHLFLDWHKCFVFHRLALESIQSGNHAPIWLEDKRISAVSSSSIDRTTVAVDSGEMGFGMFDYKQNVDQLVIDAYNGKTSCVETLKQFNAILGNNAMPQHVIDFIEKFLPEGERSIAIHESSSITKYSDADQDKIERIKKFIGNPQLEKGKFPGAMHHFKIYYNKDNKARVFYKYIGNITFLKNLKRVV